MQGPEGDLSRLMAALAPVWRDCVISVGTGEGMMVFHPMDPPRRGAGGWRATSGPARLHLRDGAGVLAFETLSSDPRGWNHGIALCSTGGSMAQPEVRICERPLGTWRIETECATLALDHREGPVPIHRLGMGPARTTPLPCGWRALAHVFPPHPARMRPGQPMAFDPARHEVFQTLLARHGRADLVDLKARVTDLLKADRFERLTLDRHGVAVVRVALRQHLALTGVPPSEDWLRRHDRPLWASLKASDAASDD